MVVDDTRKVRNMLTSMLALDGFEVVGSSGDGREAIATIETLDPDEVAAMGDVVTLHAGEQVRTAVRVAAFAELDPGQVGLLVDSYGLLALALDRRSAAEELRLHPGDAVTLEAAR